MGSGVLLQHCQAYRFVILQGFITDLEDHDMSCLITYPYAELWSHYGTSTQSSASMSVWLASHGTTFPSAVFMSMWGQ